MKTPGIRTTSLLALGILVCLGATAGAQAEIVVEAVGPGSWGAADADIGLAGGIVENFEDTQLAPGLQVEIAASDGSLTGTGWTVLPNVFNPVTGDPYGDSFAAGVWDGSHVLLNTANNQSQSYGSTDWRPIGLYVPGGAQWIAFAGQQITVNHTLIVNGVARDRLGNYGLSIGSGPNGLLIVRSTDPAEPIISISFGGRGDAFVIDHVVYAPLTAVATESMNWAGVKALYR